jgi:MFS family permease
MFRGVGRSVASFEPLANVLSSFGSSIYTPAIPDVMLDFGISDTIATLPLTTYVLGLSFGPMLSAPISETFGRLGTYRVSPPLSAVFTLAAGFSPNIAALCVLRFFAAFFGGMCLSVSAGTSADLFYPRDRGVAGTFMLYTPFLGQSFLTNSKAL